MIFAQTAPVPPVPLLFGKLRIAGLGNGASEYIEGADVMLLSSALAELVI